MTVARYRYESLAALIKAREAGELDGRHIEIGVDNDSVLVRAYDSPPGEWGDEEDIEPEFLANLGEGNPREALVEALVALGFETSQV